MEKNPYTDEYFDALRQFIKAAGLTFNKFADIAEINRSTFQTILNRRSEPSFHFKKQISEAVMLILATSSQNDSQLSQAHQRLSAAKIRLVNEESNRMWDEVYPVKKAAQNKDFDRLHTLFCQLNEEGQAEALKRIEELAFLPKYQKKDGE